MEIQYGKLNYWIQEAEELSLKIPLPFIADDKIDKYGAGIVPELDQNELDQLKNLEPFFDKFNGIDLNMEVEAEIDLNLVNIATIENIRRYANYVKNRINILIDCFKDPIYYNYIWYSAETFHSHPVKGRMITPEDPVGEEYETTALNNDPITSFVHSCSMVIGSFESVNDHIDNELNKIDPLHEAKNIYDISADRHKLVLLQKTGVFDYLCDKYISPEAPLMIKEDFQRLITNMIGAKTKDIGSDVSKLISENIDPKKKKSVETPNATKTVNAFLASLGLSVPPNT